jgi:hypothetical protein
MNPRTKTALSAVVVVVLGAAAIAALVIYPSLQANQTYPEAIHPAEAFLLPNGTLYLSVFNSLDKSVSVDSLQVALLSSAEAADAYSMEFPSNNGLGAGSVKILCCVGMGEGQTITESATWKGGGTVPSGGVALLRFQPSSSLNLNQYEAYYVAVGDEYFPSVNLEPFTAQVITNETLPSAIPVHAVVYPNETMNIALIGTGQAEIHPSAKVSFYWPVRANESYRVTPLGGFWYRLTGGQNLPPYMPLTTLPNDESVYFTIYNMTSKPLSFSEGFISQIPPIVAPSASFTGSSWGSFRRSNTAGYEVEWQLPLNGTRSYDIPVTLYGGDYRVNSSARIELSIGNLTLTSPGTFNSSYFSGIMTATLQAPQSKSGSLLISLAFGPPFQMGQTEVTSSPSHSLSIIVYLFIGVLVAVVLVLVASIRSRSGRRGAVVTPMDRVSTSNGLDPREDST